MTKELLIDVCNKSLQLKGLDTNPKYKKRLKWELEEIAARSKSDYFWNFYIKRVRYPQNQNNLLICWLLGITPDHNIEQEPKCEYGEYPDIDVDYLPIVRDYLKNIWAKETFGAEYVCNISNYTTFGIKSALIDMARVHGESREDVQTLTKGLEAKDDEGKVLTWDAAMKLYPELKKYCEQDDTHKKIADAAKRLLHRNRGMGVHAGGLIIANSPLYDLVPLVKRKDNPQASAWVEGLHGQDLGPMGLVKFDLLVISNLLQIARCCEMVKKRHGLDGICNKPGEPDWTDVAKWRDDPKSLAMANIGDLKCIFQFDSEGIRGLVRAGGVDRFEDLVAYTALFRPGPLGMKMQERYVERKRGRERYVLHPLVKPILEKTYGVLTYQEQIMRILNVVGEIPLKDCELVRKAISKKKEEGFLKYKEMFLVNGQKNLGCTADEILHLWNQIAAFAEYGFNLSMTIGTLVPVRVCGETKTKRIEEFVPGDVALCINQAGDTVETQVVALHDHGVLPGYEVTFGDGYKVTCTLDHKFLTQKGQKSLREIIRTNSSILCDPKHKMESENAEEKYGWLEGSMRDELAVTGCDVDAHEGVCDLSREIVYDGGMGGQMRSEIQDEYIAQKTSTDLLGVPEIGMENRGSGWEASGRSACHTMRDGDGYLSGDDFAPAGLHEVRGDKAKQYLRKEHEVESVRLATSSGVGCGQENVGSTRYSSGSCGTTSCVASSKPGKVCEVYRGGMEISEAIKDGNMASASTAGMGDVSNPLRKRQEASGFCERECVDRSGWVLPFQRESAPQWAIVSVCSTAGCDAERRGEAACGRDVASSEHGVFCEFDGGDEVGMVGMAAGHAEIRDTGRLVRRRIVRVMPVGERQMYDLEVANSTHNFLLPNGVVTSNSHAVAYTYISMWLLYLKTHYPHEFYASMLSCETLSEKIKEYKMEAKIHGVDMHRLDINKSGINFELQTDVVYYGMSNVKGVGEAPAKRITDSQPYKSFEDFLARFGTDASVLKPLLGLRCFRDRDPVTLWKFAEYFKDCAKKIEDKKKRYAAAMIRYEEEFKELLPTETRTLADLSGDNPFDSEGWKLQYDKDEEILVDKEVVCEENTPGATSRVVVEDIEVEGTGLYLQRETVKYYCTGKVGQKWNRWKELRKLWQKRKRSIDRYQNIERESLPSLLGFDANAWEIDDVLLKEFRDPVACEEKYYGFAWIHELERSPDYRGNLTFDALKNSIDCAAGPVELKVKKITKIKSKKGNEYHQVLAEDVTGHENKINVWADDWAWWGKELSVGNLLRVRLQPPSGGFNTFLLEANQVGKWRGQKRYRDKSDDPRVIVMRTGQKEEEKFLTDDEALEQFSNCTMEEQ